jgi:hypothetical protein
MFAASIRLLFRGKPQVAMKTESTIIGCACGAQYEREERTLPIKDIGLFECVDCGARLEIWSGRTVPMFKRVKQTSPQQRSA